MYFKRYFTQVTEQAKHVYLLQDDGSKVTIGITEYSPLYQGVYQAVFAVGDHQVTKNLLEIGCVVELISLQSHP